MARSAHERLLCVRAGSAGANARTLAPGRDLVLDVATQDGLDLPRGAALDDHLDHDARALVDARAAERWDRWRRMRKDVLEIDGLDLTSIWEIELRARCFLPAARIEIGLPRAIEAAGSDAVTLANLEAEPAGAVREVAARAGVGTMSADGSAPATGHEGRTQGPSLPIRALAAAGVPPLLRGEVLCVPYWNLAPVYQQLIRRPSGARPTASGVILPELGLRATVQAALRGGWLGHAGLRGRRRAASEAEAVLDAAQRNDAPEDGLEATIDAWALALLRDRAAMTLAAARHARRALAGGPVRSLLVPFDGVAEAAVLVDEARRAGIPSLLVQHGFDARMGAPDKGRVDLVALWSERDRSTVPSDSRAARLEVTGNPGAEHLAGRGERVERHDRTLVLVDYPSRLSARITERVGQLHVATALDALAATRPDTTALIRPHPSEQAAEAYLHTPADLRVELDVDTPLEQTLSAVDLCIGSMSTATLQAAALGVPVVYLETAGCDRPWPLDGSVVPTGRDRDELAEAIVAALVSQEVAGQAEMVEALGVRRGATAAVCDLIDGQVASAE